MKIVMWGAGTPSDPIATKVRMGRKAEVTVYFGVTACSGGGSASPQPPGQAEPHQPRANQESR